MSSDSLNFPVPKSLAQWKQNVVGLSTLLFVVTFWTTIFALIHVLFFTVITVQSLPSLNWQREVAWVTAAKPGVNSGKWRILPDVEYTYQRQGRDYFGNRLGYSYQFSALLADGGSAILRRYASARPQQPVPASIYVNPANPAEAVLLRGVPWPTAVTYYLKIALGCWAAVGLALLFSNANGIPLEWKDVMPIGLYLSIHRPPYDSLPARRRPVQRVFHPTHKGATPGRHGGPEDKETS